MIHHESSTRNLHHHHRGAFIVIIIIIIIDNHNCHQWEDMHGLQRGRKIRTVRATRHENFALYRVPINL